MDTVVIIAGAEEVAGGGRSVLQMDTVVNISHLSKSVIGNIMVFSYLQRMNVITIIPLCGFQMWWYSNTNVPIGKNRFRIMPHRCIVLKENVLKN